MIETKNITKTVTTSEGSLQILQPISFQVKPGESIAIVGASGSGKSTLLSLLAGLDEVSAGEIFLDDAPLHTMDEEQRAQLQKSIDYQKALVDFYNKHEQDAQAKSARRVCGTLQRSLREMKPVFRQKQTVEKMFA